MDPSEHEKEKIERLRRAMYSRSLSGLLKEHPRHILGESQDKTEQDFQKRIEQEKEEREEHLRPINVAPRTIGYAKTALWWLLGLSIVFFIGAVSFFAYYFLVGDGTFGASSRNIGISISGPPQIEGGSPTQLQIAVVNRNNVPLEAAELIITYPQGTRSVSDFVTDLSSQRESLGTIGPGETRRGTVSAIFAGDEDTPVGVHVELEYQIQGSNAIFVTSTDYNSTLSSSPLSLVIEGNKEAISGQPVEITVSVVSNATERVSDVLLEAQYPFGFKYMSATLDPIKAGLWAIGDLTPGQKVPIVIRGILSGEQGDNRVFRFSAGTRRSASAGMIETVFTKNTYPVAISKPFLGLSVSVGGGGSTVTEDDSFVPPADGTPASIVVAPGSEVLVRIGWQNNLPSAIKDVVIAARLSGLRIDGQKVSSDDGFYRSTDNIVLWDKATTEGALANLAPGARGTVSFKFMIPENATLEGIVDPKLSISVNAAGKRVSETGVPESLQSSITKNVSVSSNVGLITRGVYYANPFGSTGPMPPRAEYETTYAILLAVTNSTNLVSNAALVAHLPPYVRWIGIYSPASEKLAFNQTDGTVSWDIGDLPPGTGLNGKLPRQVLIAVGLTPSLSQIGQEPVLLDGIKLWGVDSIKAEAIRAANPGAPIESEVLREGKSVTTNIQGDPGFSSANATVVK